MLVLAAVTKTDTNRDVQWTAGKLIGLRMFRNGDKHFDLDIRQTGGAILLVSNFTVAGETRRGRRPSLDQAAGPEIGRRLFDALVDAVTASGVTVATGTFGADMQVELANDGPVTLIVDSASAHPEPAAPAP
jgi:D-tyrosyl-tRNA(Tyr) deacylase